MIILNKNATSESFFSTLQMHIYKQCIFQILSQITNGAFRLVPYLYIHVWPMSFRHSIRNFDKGLMGKMSRSPDFVKICQITLFLNRIKASWKNQCLSSSNYGRRLNVVFVTFQFLPNGGNAINVLWSIYLKSIYFDRQYRIWLGKPVHV